MFLINVAHFDLSKTYAVKAISSLSVRSPWMKPYNVVKTYIWYKFHMVQRKPKIKQGFLSRKMSENRRRTLKSDPRLIIRHNLAHFLESQRLVL